MRKSFSQIVLIVFASISLFAGENRWTIKGPDAGSPNKIVFDPADSSIVYASTTNGVFRSSDGGQHWTVAAVTLGTPFGDVAVASGDPQKVFASSVYGLYKSSNRGVTWSLAHPFASFKVAVSANGSVVYSVSSGGPIRSSDGGITFGSAGSGFPAATSVMALVLDPQNADTVYAALLSNGGVYKSTDGAAHWSAANSGLTASAYFSLLIDPSNGSVLYAGAGPGRIFKTTDGGGLWNELTNGLGNGFYRSMSISSSPSTIIAATDAGFYKSANAGSSWSGPSQPGADTAVAVDPFNASNILLVSSSNVVRSTNGGSTFTPAASGLTAAYTQSIAVDPRSDSIIYTSGAAGIFKSIDHGESWTSLLAGLNQSVAVDPFNSQTLYAITSGNFTRSLNGGVVWENYQTGLPSTAVGIVVDPLTPGTLYTVSNGAPYKKAGTAAWTLKNNGLPAGTFAAFVAIDPNNASVLYTGGSFGVYKSTNAGDTWTSASSGLSAPGAGGISIDRFDSNHLLAWVNSSGFESTNGGASWAPFATTAGRQAILLAFDPTTPGRVYNSSSDAVERSNDGGKTWFSVSTGLGKSHGNVFVISPTGNSLFAGGSDAGVWVIHFGRSRAVAQ
ncbi:MAG: hypothetical protein QOE68_1937 [Thermoanaerobaculia bacterium]|nr:hypothetical protein [Thermoanaerobaculia bacterium]